MTVNIIIYQIIQGFEATPPVEKSAPSSKSQGIVTKSRDGTKNSLPKLSWGVLQIEDEDEDNLKLHLWLLHFRKLEGLLKQLGTFHDEKHPRRCELYAYNGLWVFLLCG